MESGIGCCRTIPAQARRQLHKRHRSHQQRHLRTALLEEWPEHFGIAYDSYEANGTNGINLSGPSDGSGVLGNEKVQIQGSDGSSDYLLYMKFI